MPPDPARQLPLVRGRMPCENVNELMARAQRGGYAVGFFESWNLESLQGTIDAAEAARSPMILGFNGEFLSRPGRVAQERLELYAAMGRAACEAATVPCGLIFNECANTDWLRRAAILGFNLIMPADPDMPLEEYQRSVASLVKYAHAHGVSVEAEVGELPCGIPGTVGAHGTETDPETAERFVAATGVDLLAVSVGNVHIMIDGQQGLDLERLAEIHRRVAVPLVLHGGSGIASESLKQAVKLGVTKVNYGTILKQRYISAVRAALRSSQTNPHELLAMGGADDVMVAGRLAVRDAVLQRMGFLGCVGKA